MRQMRASVVLDGARVVHHDRASYESLAFANGAIAAGDASAYRIDLSGHAIFPGLINAHDHLQLNNVPPLAVQEPFGNSYEWIAAMELHRSNPAVRTAVSMPSTIRHWHGALKNILAGATTVAHHDPRTVVLDDADFPVHAPRTGWCHSLELGADRDGATPQYGPGVRTSFERTPSSTPWVVHLAEGTDERSRNELTQLDLLGCLGSNTVLVHGVGLTRRDVARVIASGASVVWCPASNLHMLAQTLDVEDLDASGRVAIGTDSRLTGSRDLLDELHVAAAHTKRSARSLVRMVTDRAAAILRLGDRGRLTEGARADCVIIRDGSDPCEMLLGARRADIRAVVRDGAPVVADPDFAQWFGYANIDAIPITLDGRPKLIARAIVDSAEGRAACALEPGLTLGAAA